LDHGDSVLTIEPGVRDFCGLEALLKTHNPVKIALFNEKSESKIFPPQNFKWQLFPP